MNVRIIDRLSADGKRLRYTLKWGNAKENRIATKIYTYTKPISQTERNHNKEAIGILEVKRSQMTIDLQSHHTGYIPSHRFKENFLDFYREFVKINSQIGSKCLSCSFQAFKNFIAKNYIISSDITENLCERFRTYLLDKYKGATPGAYFMRFKKVLKTATKQGYFKINPAEDLQSKTNPSSKKEILLAHDWQKLMNTRCANYEVKKAAIFSLYTGLRWCDVNKLTWKEIKEDTIVINQSKTGVSLEIPLHPIAKKIIGEKKPDRRTFNLPTQDQANKILKIWVSSAGIQRHITWHCLRHSLSVLLQDEGTDVATVAGILGHRTTKYVHNTYQRYKQDSAKVAINKLPTQPTQP